MNNLQQALEACAAEPIHQLGNIQSYGAVLVLSANKLHTVIQTSNNISHFINLPAESVLGQSLTELIGDVAALQFEHLCQKANIHHTATGLLSVVQQQQHINLAAHLYRTDDLWVLELCRDEGLPNREQLGELLMQMQDSLLTIESGTESIHYFEQITQLIQELYDYDRVMIYRFQPNWDGEVIAQTRVASATSYLNMHFPASDIPSQARLLYTKNLTRIVADIDAVPVQILPTLNQPLDMSHSALRSLSPSHIEYLRNLGVQASMSISLLQNGRLWGLIICHHHQPKRVSFAMREAGVFISRMISTELASIEMRSKHELLDKVTQIKTVLLKSILTQSMQQVLKQLNPELLNCLNASGLIIIVEGRHYTYGSTPDSTAIATLLSWIEKQTTTANVFSCDNLAEQFPPALAYPEIASGLIATMHSSAMKNCIIWLRKEQPRTVAWVGSYEQDLEQTPTGNFRLNPRTSFESRSELCRNRSVPWCALENDIVNTFGHTLSEGLTQKHKLQLAEKRVQALRKDREEALNRLEKIAGRVPGMVYQFHLRPDGSSCFPYSSVGIKDIYQLSPEQVREDASSVFALIHPDDYAEVQTSIQQSADKLTPWRHEYRVKLDDGTEHWLLGNAMPEQNRDTGSGMLWHGFITDITERKQCEDSQRLSNVALKAISQGVLITDTNIRILSSNNAFERITGYTQAELYQQNCRLLHGPLTDPLILNEIRLALKNASPFSGEILNYRKDGTTFWNELTISPVFDAQGRPINFVGTIRDINQRKAEQQKDKEHVNQLAHVTRLGLMGEMASGIAHEVNQPLTAITTYTQVSLNLLNSENIDLIKLAEILHKTQQQALRAGQIIRRMRGLIKSTTKQITKANLNELIQEAANLCFSELSHNQIKLTFELQTDLPLIDVDTIQIEQVIINLIRNSADALMNSPKNQQRTLSIQSQLTPNEGIAVRIKDNGIGIDEDLQQKILMPFFTTKAEGMGMGLSISRSIIEAHNGYLRFNSQTGIGSTFYFNLPV